MTHQANHEHYSGEQARVQQAREAERERMERYCPVELTPEQVEELCARAEERERKERS